MTSRPVAWFLCAASLVALASSCADETIPLATIPDTDAGAAGPPTRCVDSSGCPANSYCAKDTCGDAAGTCQIAQVVCTDPESPVCGCDRITYFNDCLRQSSGVVASTPGQCPYDIAVHCGGPGNDPCPDASEQCAKLQRLHGDCVPDLPGTCWVLPAKCPPPGTDRWNDCDNGLQCIDTCTAIGSGATFRRAGKCP